MIINCIIIEDEPLAMERTKDYVLKMPFLNLVSTFESGLLALDFIRSNKIDLILLDINMGELSGIQLLESTKFSGQVIITTAYPEYALKGYELSVTDYLLKPFTFERFVQAINKAHANLLKTETNNDKRSVFIKTEYRLEHVALSDILYIEGMRDYRRVHTIHKKIMTLQTFKEFEKEIPNDILCRVHKSFMVALDKIESVERDRIKIKEKIIPISETYKQLFFQKINHAKK